MGNLQSDKSISYNVFIGPEAKPGETRVIRSSLIGSGDLAKYPEKDIKTILDILKYSVKNFSERNYLGSRRIKEDETYSSYQWKTFEEVYQMTIDYIQGIKSLNLCKFNTETGYKCLGIYSKNREEWVISDYSAYWDSITIVTFYDSLGDNTVEFILNQTKLETIFVEADKLKKIIDLKKENKTYNLLNLIVTYDSKKEEIENAKQLGLNVYLFEEVIKEGKGKQYKLEESKPESISTICYTSGTTGEPKGVLISHFAVIAEISAINYTDVNLGENDIYFSYLPLAHIYEKILLSTLMLRGISIGFFCGDTRKLMQDVQMLKPTLFAGVPKIFNRVYDKIVETIKSKSLFIKLIFERAVKEKIDYYRKTKKLTHYIWDKLIFNTLKKALGGNVRVMLNGSAPILPDVVEFLKICFGCPILEGYGQTECTCGCSMTFANDPIGGHCGGIFAGVEAKLVDIPHLNYLTSDVNKETNLLEPRGELCIRGNTIFSGYFNNPELTRQVLDEDGWLHTGDVSMILTSYGNALKVIDRIKDLFKLSQGEYIAPDKIENILSKNQYVNQIFVHGEPFEDYLVAIVVPEKDALVKFMNQKGQQQCTLSNIESFYDNEELKSEIIKDLDKLGRYSCLKGFELVKKIYLTKEQFTIQNKELTPTMKYVRNVLKQNYITQIQAMYSKL